MKQVELMVLAALAEAPAHGYALAQRVAELTGGRLEVRPGNLYRVLERLEGRGLVRESPDESSAAEDERRRYFSVTARGRRAAESELAMYADVLARTRGLKERLVDG